MIMKTNYRFIVVLWLALLHLGVSGNNDASNCYSNISTNKQAPIEQTDKLAGESIHANRQSENIDLYDYGRACEETYAQILSMQNSHSQTVLGGVWSNEFIGPNGTTGRVSAIVQDAWGNVYVGGCFEYAFGVAANNIVKWDGVSWSSLGAGVTNPTTYPYYTAVYAIVIDSIGNVYVGGDFIIAGDTTTANNVAKWDGTSWSSMGSGFSFDNPNQSHPKGVFALAINHNGHIVAGGNFTRSGTSTRNRIASWNGSNWSSIGSFDATVRSLAVDGNGILYAGGAFSNNNYYRIAKYDGIAWSALGSGMNSYIEAIAVDSNGNVYAGGNFTSAGGNQISRFAKWDGSSWSALGSGTFSSAVRSIAIDNSGSIYVGGLFETIGNDTVNSIAKWDGNNWLPVGKGVYLMTHNGWVDVVMIDNNGTLFAGGQFYGADDIGVSNIAKYSGTSWSGLGSGFIYGMNGRVNAIAQDSQGNLYVGGDFRNAGNAFTQYIAKFDGSKWSSLGSGLNQPVHAIAVDSNDHIYVAGSFTFAGNVLVNRIAKWDGSSWSALGDGLNNTVHSLAIDNSGDIYAGGFFETSGGITVHRIAKWNGSSWSSLGNGLEGGVYAIAIDSAGAVYAGGYYLKITGATGYKTNFAKWNGNSWSYVGNASQVFNNDVYSIEIDANGDVFVGGIFTYVDNMNITGIAKWDGSTWSSPGDGQPYRISSAVNAMEQDDLGNIYVCYDTSLFYAMDRKIAKWDGSSWKLLTSGIDNVVRSMKFLNNTLYCGGDFWFVENTISSAFFGAFSEQTSSIQLPDTKSGFRILVYPNPAKDMITIDLASLGISSGEKFISVATIAGKIIYSKKMKGDTTEIDLSHQANGMYLINVQTSNGSYTQKIIKQ